MKLIIATSTYEPDVGGMQAYARDIGDWLARSHTVTIVTYSTKWNFQQDARHAYRVIRVWRKIPKPFRQIWYTFRLLFAARHADVMYVLGALSAGIPTAVAAKVLGKKYVLRISGDRVWEGAVVQGKTHLMIGDFQEAKHIGWIGFLWRQQAWVAKKAAHNIAHSRYIQQMLLGWGVDEKRISLVHTGIMPITFLHRKEEARKKIGVHGKIILSVGRLVPWKGFKLLIKLMPRLLEINPFFRLVIVGDGPDRNSLATMIKNLGLHNKVILAGDVASSNMHMYWASADILVLNTGYEGLSHVVLEALSAGVPVITTTAGGNKELITQGENGFLVKYNDEFNLLEAIKTIYENKELRAHFIENGKKTAARYTIEHMCLEAEKVLEKIFHD